MVAAAGSDDKAQFALDNGADYAINYTTEEIRTRVKELVGGADVVYDPVSGNAFTIRFAALISKGGSLSSASPAGPLLTRH